jgi:phage terminase large subunit-like protein
MSLSFAARASKYARDALSGKIPACLYVRQACQRHLNNLESSKRPEYPFRFDREAADHICSFAENMVHVKGEWAGGKIKLQPWQIFLFSVTFGWLRKADGLRRFREIYWEIPRKNSKSTMGAIAGNYMAWADGEPGAEVYSGATSEKQAWEVFGPARLMVRNNREFREHFGIFVGAQNLSCLEDGSKFEPIIGKPGDGASPHCALVDEYHEHSSSDLYDTMLTGMGARLQPMLMVITTAGTDTSGPCFAKRDYAVKVLAGVIENEELFPVIYTIDEEDDWTQEATWRKANPNYGVSVYADFLEARRKEAMQVASRQNVLKCKHLNVWSNAAVAWLNMLDWAKCEQDISLSDFKGEKAWIGVDLAQKGDLTAMIILFRREKEYYLFGKYYLPEDTVRLPHNAHYQIWEVDGYLTVTPGAVTDYQFLLDDLLSWVTPYAIQGLAYDPNQATFLMQQVEKAVSFDVIEITQSRQSLNEPMQEFGAAVKDAKMHHDGNPVLTWMAANVKLPKGNVKYIIPCREGAQNKIDGIVAAIMAVKIANLNKENGPSIYETRGLTVLGETERSEDNENIGIFSACACPSL